MRTSGGAGASPRRLRDAAPGALHPLVCLLLALSLCCSLVAADAPSQWSPQLQLESHVTVGNDGIATSRGAGRQRSDGLSITRSVPVDTSVAPDAAVDDQAIKFTPPRVELGRMETCSPQRYYVGVENRGRVSVRLDGADFTHDGFSLATDVRGIRLDPGDRFNLQFVFLPSEVEPNGVDAHLRVLTTSGLFALPISSPEVAFNRYGVSAIRASVPAGVRFGQSLQFVNPVDYTIRITEIYALDSFVHIELLNGSKWIGPRWPKEEDAKEARQEVPGEYDKELDYARRADRGAWDMPAGTTSPLIKVSLLSNTPGVYFTHIHIAAGNHRLLLVPVHITVLKPGIHIEPKELDLGVLTDLHENEPREVFFTLFNSGVNPIDVLELKVLESNLIVSAQLWGGSTVIPPRTQVYSALAVQLRVDKAKRSGSCFASLLLKTNASSSELGQRKLKLYGQVIRGNMAFQPNETRVGVVLPLQNLFYGGDGINDTTEKLDEGQIVDDEETSTTKLVSIIGENASMGVMAGTSAFQKLRLWNRFDRPLELQRVWIDYLVSDGDESQEVSVYSFKQGVAAAGSSWPKISLQITPAVRVKEDFPAIRSYPLVIETNVTRHRIQIYVFHGFLSVDSSRGLQNYSVSGYYSSNSTEMKSSQSCLVVPDDGVVPSTSPRIDGGDRIADTQGVQICRSLLFDLEKVASHKSRTEVVEIKNENPVPITLKIMSAPTSDMVDLSIKAPHDTIAERVSPRNDTLGQASNNTGVVTVNDTFVLQPGHQVVFYVKVQAKDTLGELTVPVMSIGTPVEVLHFHARLRSVRGTVEPITPAIVLPSMFPGRTQVIHLKYRNTFEHPVIPLMATISSPHLQLLSMRDTMAPKQVENVLDLLFSPAADSKCSDALFLADCLLPESTTVADQTCEQLSGYGELVDENDLAALSRRNAFWSRTLGSDHLSTVETQVHLQTDIIDDVAEVTVKGLLERPLVTASSNALANPSNGSTIFERKEFALTELLQLSHIFVNVRNPSNVSVLMELTRAEADEALFYSCDEGLGYSSDDAENDAVTEISALCLDEWKGAALNSVELQRDVQVDLNVPPFYFRKKIIQVSAGEEAQLGPIYYLPSKVQEVKTVVFVRNSLSHIEPVSLLARSGKGALDLLVDAPTQSGNSDKTRFIPYRLATGMAEIDDIHDFEGTLRFDVTQRDVLTDYSRSAEILLSNTGPFGLTINRVMVEGKSNISWLPSIWASRTASLANDFEISLEYIKPTSSSGGDYVVLQPGKIARLQVSFCASCFSTNVASWLLIDSSDSVKLVRLEGTITADAAFSCLRSRMSPSSRYALRAVWMLAAIIAVISTLHTLLVLVYDEWTSQTTNIAPVVCLSVRTKEPGTATVSCTDGEESTVASRAKGERDAVHQTLESINRHLSAMEKAAFSPAAHVVTPAVAALLERRHKGVYSTARSDQLAENVLPHEITLETKAGQGAAVLPPVAKVEEKDNKAAVVHVAGVEKLPPFDVASTAAQASLQGVQEEVVSENSTDKGTLLLSTEAREPVSEPNIILSQLLDDSDDHKHSDLSSDDGSSELSSAASSHSTNLQPDSEKSSRGATISIGSDKSVPIGTPSPQKEGDPFEAFKSLAERWRTQDWQDNLNDSSPPSLSAKFPTLEDWNGTLSFNTLGQGLVGSTVSNQRDENVRSGSRSESSSFIGAGSTGLYVDSFSTFAGSAAPTPTRAPIKATSTKAPPGFTPADAKPLETRAAFEQLRSGSGSTSSTPITCSTGNGFGGSSAFASNLPLFGPALPPANYNHVGFGGAGRIGSGRSKVLRTTENPSDTATDSR